MQVVSLATHQCYLMALEGGISCKWGGFEKSRLKKKLKTVSWSLCPLFPDAGGAVLFIRLCVRSLLSSAVV